MAKAFMKRELERREAEVKLMNSFEELQADEDVHDDEKELQPENVHVHEAKPPGRELRQSVEAQSQATDPATPSGGSGHVDKDPSGSGTGSTPPADEPVRGTSIQGASRQSSVAKPSASTGRSRTSATSTCTTSTGTSSTDRGAEAPPAAVTPPASPEAGQAQSAHPICAWV